MPPLPPLELAQAAQLLDTLSPAAAFDRLADHLLPDARAADPRSANSVLLKLAGRRRRDPRWRDRLLPLLRDPAWAGTAEYALGRDPSTEARDALLAAVEAGLSDQAAATLAHVGDHRALPHLLRILRDGGKVHPTALFPAIDLVVDASAVEATILAG
jgi:hypothetical protein